MGGDLGFGDHVAVGDSVARRHETQFMASREADVLLPPALVIFTLPWLHARRDDGAKTAIIPLIADRRPDITKATGDRPERAGPARWLGCCGIDRLYGFYEPTF